MIKLFLVEDEIIMRNGIRNIDWASRNIELVGEASDGELAYPMILEKKPDILLTDIKMPFMDGLELSERVKNDLPDIQIIILSGFDEFTYAQKAVSLGVTEYLLKPVTPGKLLETVDAVKQKIEEQRRKEDIEYADGIPEEKRELQRQRLFRHLVMNTKSSGELLDLAKQVDVNLAARYFSIVLMFLQIRGESGADYSQTRNDLQERLEFLLAEQSGWTLFDRGENGFAMLVARYHEDSIQNSMSLVIENICAAADVVPDLEYYIAVGPRVNRVSEIRTSYEQATKAASHRFMTDPNQVIYADAMPSFGGNRENVSAMDFNAAVTNRDFREGLDRFLKTGTKEEIELFLDDMFVIIGDRNLKSRIFMTYILMDMYFSMQNFAREMEIDTESIEQKRGGLKDLLRNEFTSEDARAYVVGYLTDILSGRDSKKEGRYNTGLGKALKYIDEHYQQEDLSLTSAASIANISPNHFSAIFSQNMGMTFMEYLIGKRIQKAQELLMTTEMRSSEIAFEVGYKDPHYFSHTFKKNTGMSPKEYRMRGGSKES